jgi:hypothetical protein
MSANKRLLNHCICNKKIYYHETAVAIPCKFPARRRPCVLEASRLCGILSFGGREPFDSEPVARNTGINAGL